MEHDATRQQQDQDRPQDDAPGRGRDRRLGLARRWTEARDAVFDVADFAAIAHFAGIDRGRRAE